MTNALEVNNLSKCYKNSNFNLDNINFNIPQGSIVGLVGKNGAGKSSTINSILNIIKKDSGTITIFNETMQDTNTAIREDIGVVFDTCHFHESLTPKNLNAIFKGIYKNWDSNIFFTNLEKFNLPENKKIKTLSRGMMMKLSLSVALSHQAKLLILDEATAGLDPVAREEILDTFLDFVEDENNSILISSHISTDLEKIADYIIIIDAGKIILNQNKDVLIYQYGIARMKEKDFNTLDPKEYLASRKRGLQFEVLIENKKSFATNHPNIIIDNSNIDEILALLTKGDDEKC